MLNYSPSNPPPKSRITNKRVAFPLNTQSTAPLDPSKPPTVPPLVPPVKLLQPTSQPSGTNAESFDILQNEFASTSESLNNLLTGVNNEDVKQRIELMKNMWQNGKFTQSVQKTIHELVQSICDKDVNKANELQLKLMMESSAECGTWMTAFRHLITNQ